MCCSCICHHKVTPSEIIHHSDIWGVDEGTNPNQLQMKNIIKDIILGPLEIYDSHKHVQNALQPQGLILKNNQIKFLILDDEYKCYLLHCNG